MKIIDGHIRLTELAKRLGVTPQSLRNHLKNNSGLGENAVKFGDTLTADYWLPLDSVVNFLNWAISHGKKMKDEMLYEVLEEVKVAWLNKV